LGNFIENFCERNLEISARKGLVSKPVHETRIERRRGEVEKTKGGRKENRI